MEVNDFSGDTNFKTRYLDYIGENYSVSSSKNVKLLLKIAKKYEVAIDKDLYEFNNVEMLEMLIGSRIKTVNALKHRMSVYSSYVNKAISEDKIEKNVFKLITPDTYMSIIDKEAYNDRYIIKNRLFEDINSLINAQDQVIFALLFDGVMGRNYTNLANLKIVDINTFTRKVKLYDGIEIILSSETLEIIQNAIVEQKYVTHSETEIVYDLPENDYVLKAPKRPKGSKLEPVCSNSIRTRIDLLKKVLNLADLTGRSIYLSGVAERYLFENDGDYSLPKLENWLRKYNVSTNTSVMMEIIKMIKEKIPEYRTSKDSI